MKTDTIEDRQEQAAVDQNDRNPELRTTEDQLMEYAVAERQASADGTVKTHVALAVTAGLVPLPAIDVALLVGNQVKMVHGLSKIYEIPFEENRVKSIVTSLITGSAPVLGVIGLSTGAKLIPGIGSLVGSGGVSVVGGALTYAVGRVFIYHFESGGTLLTFDAKKMRGLFKKEFDAGRDSAAKEDSRVTVEATAEAS